MNTLRVLVAATLLILSHETAQPAQAGIFDRPAPISTGGTAREVGREAAERVITRAPRPTDEGKENGHSSDGPSTPPRVPTCVLVSFRMVCI